MSESEYLASNEGREAIEPYDFTRAGYGQYLENRIIKAFRAGRRSVVVNAELLAACKALPLDCEFTDAADFKDNSGRFMVAMELARAAIASATKHS